MTASDSLSLLETPHVLDALADISQDRGHPLLQEDVCLWVGGGGSGTDHGTHRTIAVFFCLGTR